MLALQNLLITTVITAQIRLSSKQPMTKPSLAWNCSCDSTERQNVNLMLPLKAMNIQYLDALQPGSLCYWQLRIKRLKPHPFDVFSWPLFYLFLWGVELKGSMTTSQTLAQCVLRGQEGRYTSACWGGFLRTSTHLDIFNNPLANAKKNKKNPMSDQQRKQLTFWKLSLYIYSRTALPLSSCFPSALPVTQACAFIYRNWPAAEKKTLCSPLPVQRLQWSAVADQLKRPSDRRTERLWITWFTTYCGFMVRALVISRVNTQL